MYRSAASFSLIIFTALVFLSGCADDTASSDPAVTTTASEHNHSAGDELVWPLMETIADTDYEIWLGHHGNHFHSGDKIEPAISITKDGQSVDNAQVFSGLVNADNAESVPVEVPTTYEPATSEEIAHYAQGELVIPADAKDITIRYRITFPDLPDDITRDVTVDIGH